MLHATGVYHVAEHFYLLFQHQTTAELSRSMNDLFGPAGSYSFLRQLGPRVALLAPDSRAQRTVQRVISPEAYDAIFARWGAQVPLWVIPLQLWWHHPEHMGALRQEQQRCGPA
jgi:hypothetical protein